MSFDVDTADGKRRMVTILRGVLGTPLVLLYMTQKKFTGCIAGAIILSVKVVANITMNYKDL